MAAGAGWTAAADASITRTVVGVSSGSYTSPTTNGLYVGCFSTQFTSSTKAGATEWTTGSDGSYARQQVGAAGANWTIAAYANGAGVVFSNTNTITFPAVTLNNQTLFSVGLVDTVGPTGGNINIFADLSTSVPVNTTQSVVLPSNSPGPAGLQFTTF